MVNVELVRNAGRGGYLGYKVSLDDCKVEDLVTLETVSDNLDKFINKRIDKYRKMAQVKHIVKSKAQAKNKMQVKSKV